MEITRLKWPADHPILSDLDINLLDENGNPYKTIIIAGDNGLGKSTILQSINDIMIGKSCDLDSFEYNIGNDKYIAAKGDNREFLLKKDGGEFVKTQFKKASEGQNAIKFIGELDHFAPQQFHSIMSDASTDFISNSGKDNDYELTKKLLITLERQDNEDYRKRNKDLESQGQPLMSNSYFLANHSKIETFKQAFNNVFDVLKFDRIQSDFDTTRTIFTKDRNEEIDIDNLSTGEKQIVFRGSSILSRAEDADIVLLDEPEISMHPRWMQKILRFYQDLITEQSTGNQKSQLFITTHSDLLIKNAAGRNDVLIIRLIKDGNALTSNKPDDMVLPSPTSAEINYTVFGINSTDYHIQLFSHLHSKIMANDNTKWSIKKADISIKGQRQCIQPHLKRYEHMQDGQLKNFYETLPCYVRNCIDHPDSQDSQGNIQTYTEQELEDSINLLRELIKEQKERRYDYSK